MGSDGYFEAAYRMSKESDVLFEKLLGRRMKEHISLPEIKDENEKKMSPEQSFHHPLSTSSNSSANEKRWSFDFNMWHSVASVTVPTKLQEEIENETILLTHSHQQLRTEVELVYNLLSLSNDKEELAKTFLAMSSSPESCVAIRQSGCMPLLVQLIHNPEESKLVRHRARQALHNIVRYHPDDKQGSREMRVLKLIEYLMEYCNDSEHESSSVATNGVSNGTSINNGRMRNAVGTDCSRGDTVVDKKLQDNHPGAIIAALMKLSFDEEHRHAMCQLGALQVIAKLIEKDHQVHNNSRVDDDDDDNNSNDAGTPRQLHPECVTLRRYAGMSLTNLTFGDSRNKALLCSLKPFMSILISQLSSPNEDLCQVTASVLRNLSWRTDTVSKQTLRELGAVTALMNAAMRVKNESTLKAVLSALWNLSSHCNLNKIDICNVDGAVAYLVNMLVAYQAPSKTLLILENVGGILRNISNVIAVREDYREILRQNNCLQIFVNQLKSPSLTVVNNACGTLWNLSARNTTDQRTLWQLGAVPMLRSLTHSKHKMISIGSSAALKNLVSSRPEECDLFDRNSKGLPSLLARKRRALEQELDPSLAETCDNIEHVENWDSFTMSFSSSCHINSDNPNNANDDDNNNNNSHNNNKNNDGSICSDTTFEMDVAPDAIGQCRPSSAIINLENGNSIFPSNDITDEKSQNDKRSSSVKMIDNNVNDKSYQHQQQSGKTTEIIIAEDNDETYGGDYAETDLDQPTNYSLKYTEQQHDMVKTYYTEGTPHTFSTSTSMSDLRQVMTINSSVPETPPKDDHQQQQQQQSCSPQSGGNTDSRSRPEMNAARTTTATTITKEPAKTVTFDTPMMFSRSSSLGSLSSYEQPDDRSSVVSDFSRLASGMISPSDLPDSPSQTVPPSPRPSIKQSPPVYCNGENAASATIIVADVAAAATTKDDSTNGIFEDSLKVFKDENTPLHFSTATSLSSLTFDDDIQHQQHHQNLAILPSLDEVVSSSEDVVVKSQPQSLVVETTTTAAISKTTLEKNLIDDNLLPESVIIDADDDEDLSLEEQRAMLDACIKSGILNTKKVEKRKSLNFRPFDEVKSNNNNNKIRQYIKTTTLDDDDDDRSNKSSNRIIAASSNKAKSSYSSPTGSIDDITVNFCTEDTPANISHAASNSDLSLLCPSEDSFLQDSILPLTSSCNDDVELLPLDEQKKLLNECIKAGLKTLNNSAAGNGTSRMIDHHHHHHRNGTTDATTSSKKHLQQVDNLPIHEQKSLLKKCIMAGINNVTTASGSSFPLSSSSPCSYNNNNNQNNRNNNDGSSTTTLLNYSNDNTIIAQHQSAAAINVELPEDEQKSLLKQCIAMGIRNIKDVSCDLENIGPPSFLAEANLENSLTNVDSIISEVADDSPTLSIIDDVTIVEDGLLDGFEVGECLVSNRERYTPKQKRRQVKDRYSTYTINSSNKEDELASNRKLLDIKTDTGGGGGGNIDGINVIKTIMEKPRKSFMIKERRALNRDRFKTRTLNEGDFNDLTAYESDKTNYNNNSPFKYEEESTRPQSSSSAGTTGVSSISSIGSGMLQDRTENVVSTTTIILRNTNNNNSDNNIDSENANDYGDDGDDGDAEEQTIVKAKVVKPLVVKSGVVANSSKIKSGSINSSSSSSSIPKPKSTAARPLSSPAATAATTRSKIPTKLPTPLQRQGTFTKDDNNDAAVVMSAAVAAKSPVKKSSAAMKLFNSGIDNNNNNNSNGGSTNLLNRQDCTPRNNGGGLLVKNCRIRSSYNGGGADVRNNRWSISDNSINTVSSFKSSSNSNLHLTIGAAGSTAIPSVKASPPMAVPSSSPSSAMQQQQPNKKEVTSKIAGLWKKSKSSKTTK